jgi:hypothetical protein
VAGASLELDAATADAGTGPGINDPFTTAWKDTSGGNHNGTLTSMAGTTDSGWAGAGTGADPYRCVFDAVNDHVNLGTAMAAIYSSKVFSIEAWASFPLDSAPNQAVVMAHDDAFANAIDIRLGGGTPYATMICGGASVNTNIATVGHTDDGLMHHYVATADGTYLRFYVDGDLQKAPVAISANAFGTITVSRVGSDGWYSKAIWACATARVYPVALTADQIRQNYLARVDTMYPRTRSAVYNGVWVRQGTLPTALGEASVYWNGSVWQAWGSSGNGLSYLTAPALTGPWTAGAHQELVGGGGYANSTYSRAQVRVIGGTYHLLIACEPGGTTGYDSQYDHFTSEDGVTWTISNDAVLVLGESPAWDSKWFGNIEFWLEDATYYALYEAGSTGSPVMKLGLATAADLDGPWTKDAGNPLIGTDRFEAGSPTVIKTGGVYYCWFLGGHRTQLPTDIYRASAAAPTGPWTVDVLPLLERATVDEGVGWHNGEVADPEVVEYDGRLYMVYTATTDGVSGGSWSAKLASCELPDPTAEYVYTDYVTISTASGVVAAAGKVAYAQEPSLNHPGAVVVTDNAKSAEWQTAFHAAGMQYTTIWNSLVSADMLIPFRENGFGWVKR